MTVSRDHHKIWYEMWFTVCEVPASILVDHLHVPWKDAAHCPELHYSMCYKIQMLSEVPPFFFFMYHIYGNAGSNCSGSQLYLN